MYNFIRNTNRCAGLVGLYFLLVTGVQADAPLQPSLPVAMLYQKDCAACHGEQGDGKSRAQFGLNPPPRDFTTPESWYELSTERILTSIKYGRAGTAMVGWGKRLSDEEIASLAAYIRETFMRDPGDDNIHLGKQLYKKNCGACHGDRGSGASWTKNSLNPSPRDFTAPQSRSELTRERMVASVTKGRSGTAMMPFDTRLSESEIAAVVDYIRAEFMRFDDAAQEAKKETPPVADVVQEIPVAAADMSMVFPHGLTGDYERGRRFFLQNCTACHGKQGDGKGPRSSFIYPPPRNFLMAESRRSLNRPALYRAVSNGRAGTVMPAWSKVLDDQQIADVAEFIFQAFIRAGMGEGADESGQNISLDSHKKKDR